MFECWICAGAVAFSLSICAPAVCEDVSKIALARQFTAACALSDLDLVTEIELAGLEGRKSGDDLFMAYNRLIEARAACSDGKEQYALSEYELTIRELRK